MVSWHGQNFSHVHLQAVQKKSDTYNKDTGGKLNLIACPNLDLNAPSNRPTTSILLNTPAVSGLHAYFNMRDYLCFW